ncbi:hypothetical protein ALQ69_200129 [Pseudomonas savastanoi pv. glycinea]|nr:hypothetical protein ALQ69_200129 [Pseudomonas savastanoi pv. glycinea]
MLDQRALDDFAPDRGCLARCWLRCREQTVFHLIDYLRSHRREVVQVIDQLRRVFDLLVSGDDAGFERFAVTVVFHVSRQHGSGFRGLVIRRNDPDGMVFTSQAHDRIRGSDIRFGHREITTPLCFKPHQLAGALQVRIVGPCRLRGFWTRRRWAGGRGRIHRLRRSV